MKRKPNYIVRWDPESKRYNAWKMGDLPTMAIDKDPVKALKLLRKELKRHG